MNRRVEGNAYGLDALLGPDGSALVLSDRRSVNLMRVRAELERSIVEATPFAGFAPAANCKCTSLIGTKPEQAAYMLGARDLIDSQALILSDPLPMANDLDALPLAIYVLKTTCTDGVGILTVKAPALPKQPDLWCAHLSKVARSCSALGSGQIVFAECGDVARLNEVPIGFSNALLVAGAEPDRDGFAFSVRAHPGSVLSFLGYRPQLVQVLTQPDGSVDRQSVGLTSPSRLTRKLLSLRKQGKSLQAIADEVGVDKSTVLRRIESAASG